MKILYRKTGNFARAWGFGFDAALRYDMGQWHFAASGKDITSTFNAWRFNTSGLGEVFAATGNELPENSRMVIVLHVMHGLRYREVAEILGCPLGTVQSRMHNAVQLLRRKVQRKLSQPT